MTESRPPGETPRAAGPAWPRIVPFALFIVLMMAEPWAADAVSGVMDPRWLYAVRSALTAAALLFLWGHYVELRDTPATGAGGWLLGAAVGAVVFGVWIVLDVDPLTIGEPDPFVPTREGGGLHAGLVATRIAGAALVVPVMEELFWRSFLMRWIHHPRFLAVDPGKVGMKALLVSSVVFALEHRLWFAGLLAGLAYGELYRRTGDLRVVVLAHALTNALLGWYVVATGSWNFW